MDEVDSVSDKYNSFLPCPGNWFGFRKEMGSVHILEDRDILLFEI